MFLRIWDALGPTGKDTASAVVRLMAISQESISQWHSVARWTARGHVKGQSNDNKPHSERDC